ncbi:hypothetical protein BDY24DRAFT_1886 [Mrakia frigida]|uniref:uncharacterized protein n=1 Tax=Mrakia frigida TaxID=29902 RepID=UPI003FCC1165
MTLGYIDLLFYPGSAEERRKRDEEKEVELNFLLLLLSSRLRSTMDTDLPDFLCSSLPSPSPSRLPPNIEPSSSAASLSHLPLVLPDGRSISLLDPSPFEELPARTRLPETQATILNAAIECLFLPPFHQGSQKDRVLKQLATYLSLPVKRVRRFFADEERKTAALKKKERSEEAGKRKGKGKAKAGGGMAGKGKEKEREVEEETEVVQEVDVKKQRRRTIKKDLLCLEEAYSPTASSSGLLPAQPSSSLTPLPFERSKSPFLLYSYDPVSQRIEVSDVKELLADLLPPRPPQPTSLSQQLVPDESSSSSQSNAIADLIDYEVPPQEALIPVGTLIFDPNASSDFVVAQHQAQELNASKDHLSDSLSVLIPENGPSNVLDRQDDLLSFSSVDGGLETAQQMQPFSQNQAAVGFERFGSSSPLLFSFDLPSPTSGPNSQQTHKQLGSNYSSLLLPSPSIKPVVVVEGEVTGGDEDVEMLDLESVAGIVSETERDEEAWVELEIKSEIEPIPTVPQSTHTHITPIARRVKSLPSRLDPLSSSTHRPLHPLRSQQLL